MSVFSRTAAFAFALGIALPALSQAPVPHAVPPPPQAETAAPPDKQTLDLDVVVTNKAGKTVPGLGQHDFAVTDNGRISPIQTFAEVHEAATPTEIVIVIDAVNTRYSSVAYERDELKKLLTKMPDPLPSISIALVTDTTASMQGSPTRDRAQLLSNLANLDVSLRFLRRDTGFYGAVERFQICLRALSGLVAQEANRPGRKLVLWISPGWPLLSGPAVQLSRKDQDGFFRSIVGLSGLMRASRVVLYAVDPLGTTDAGGFRTFYYKSFLKPVKRPQDIDLGDLSLQVLATQSGGLVLNSNNDIAGELQRCLDDASEYYTLTLQPMPAEQADEFHEISVKVEGAGLSARTRNGYYAQPGSAALPASTRGEPK